MKLHDNFHQNGNAWNQLVVLSGIRDIYSHVMIEYSSRMSNLCTLVDLYNDYFLVNFIDTEVD